MSRCPDLARKEHSNILLFDYLVVVVRAGFGRTLRNDLSGLGLLGVPSGIKSDLMSWYVVVFVYEFGVSMTAITDTLGVVRSTLCRNVS